MRKPIETTLTHEAQGLDCLLRSWKDDGIQWTVVASLSRTTSTSGSPVNGSKSVKLEMPGTSAIPMTTRSALSWRSPLRTIPSQGILFWHIQVAPVRKHAGAGQSRFTGHSFDSIVKQGRLAPKFIDGERLHMPTIGFVEQSPGPYKRGEYASSLNVTDEQYRRRGIAGHLHVDDVAVSQVDFSRTPGALEHHDIEGLGQPLKSLLRRSPILTPHATKILRTQGSDHLASDDELRCRVRFGLDQDRIEVGSRRQPAGGGLDGLCPADFFAVRRDEGIVGHVLRLEGCDTQAATEKTTGTRPP
jgi:hypothetical protein